MYEQYLYSIACYLVAKLRIIINISKLSGG
jgi:hypothetical protein